MPFSFLIYLQPTHYFRLCRKDNTSVFPLTENLPLEIIEQLEADVNFKCEKSRIYDLSWQALQKGYIGSVKTYVSFEKVPLADEYRFLQKYFHKAWVFYVLLLRLISFHNPINEIKAWKISSNVSRSNYLQTPINYSDWPRFQPSLVSKRPLVSVVIPTLNRYEYLKDVLEDLERQEYKDFEVIIVDQSLPFQEEFYSKFNLKMKVVQQKERALWLARNHAVEISEGEYILLFDDDSRVKCDWITNHLKCIDFFDADISSGVSISTVGAEVPKNYSFFRISDQIDTGNVLIKKQIFREIGLFDRQFEKQRMGDGEFGLRAYLNNYKNISNPYAGRIHLKVGSGGLREMGSWDAFRPKKWFGPRPVPSVLYLFRKYYGTKLSLLSLLKTLPPAIIPYQFKKSKKGIILGFILTAFIFPIIMMQILKSWRLASIKIKEGPLIENLK
ncbi:glycosyltransferase family 2 protein [Mesoflavibacter zeaxanthinifaciens]|uniref:glycosyltransferase family 2 protein n=1 Tax=Mesoflavibacter zeaxanthinifaciens TaxID=393060 RepID=UPI003A930E1E